MFIRSAGLLLTLAGVMLIGSMATAAPQAPPPGKGKPSKVAYIVDKFAGAVGRERAAGRRASRLSNPLLHARDNGGVELLVHARGRLNGGERQDLTKLGATVVTSVSSLPGLGEIEAWVPSNRVDDVAALDWVVAVTPPGYSQPDNHPTNPTNSQGVAFHNANVVQNPRGINGAGVNVGVISDGITTIASSDLPAVTNLGTGSGDEGTAMLEIVHDMAPGAGLLFNATGNSVATHVNALNNLVTNNANVIAEDIPFDAEPAFQVGQAAQTAQNIAAGGVSVHSSAGNQALRHTARVLANGTGSGPDGTNFGSTPSGCTYGPNNVVDIDPAAGANATAFDVTLGNGGGSFTLQWSEPRSIFPTAGQGGFTDLDLFVMDAGLTQCLGESIAVQGFGQGDTIEQVTFGTGLGGTQAKVIVQVFGTSNAVATPIIDLRGRGWTAVDNPTRAGSLNPDSNYAGGQATSAAALNAQNAGAIEAYSSGGPVQIITTTQCSTGASGLPCDGASGHGSPQAGANTTATGPTWAAADNVNVTGVGGFGSPFTGTSAAAPHAAGCDALLRSSPRSTPTATPASTNARLIATAAAINPAGPDNTTGVGRLDCLQAVNRPPVANAGGPYGPVPEGTSVTLTAAASSDPDTGDSIASYSWDLNNDTIFGDATGVTASFTPPDNGVFTVSVRVTDQAGVTNTASTTVTATNVPPTVGVITAPTGPVQIGTPIATTASFTDPGTADTHTAVWDWGDSSMSAGVVTETNGSGSVTGSHTYTTPDLYTVTLTVTDDDLGSGQSVFQYVIVFDPLRTLAVNAKITSPAGAYLPNPTKTGDAFSTAAVRYKNGVPSGGTNFQFNAAPFIFNATSYQWLIVTTSGRGYAQGAGVVNGVPGYSFLLSVVDGVPDKFRFKVWNTATTAVVYDSQFGAPINAPANIPLSFGSVVLG